VALKCQLAVVHDLYCAEQWRKIVETITLAYGPGFAADLPEDLTRNMVLGPDGPLTCSASRPTKTTVSSPRGWLAGTSSR
jgi:hypothetical protein